MRSNDPLRRVSLAIGAGSVIALAAISPVLAGRGIQGSTGDAPSYEDIVSQYPIAALMDEVECDEDDLIATNTDNEDEQAEADEQEAEDQAEADDQEAEDQDEDTSSAKPHKSHQSNDEDEDEDEDDESDDEDDESDDEDDESDDEDDESDDEDDESDD